MEGFLLPGPRARSDRSSPKVQTVMVLGGPLTPKTGAAFHSYTLSLELAKPREKHCFPKSPAFTFMYNSIRISVCPHLWTFLWWV